MTDEEKLQKEKQNFIREINVATEKATKLIIESALHSSKMISAKSDSDHDLLIKLDTKMEGLKEAINNLQGGVSSQLRDHDVRLNKLEDTYVEQKEFDILSDKHIKQDLKMSNYVITLSLFTLLVSGLIGIMIYHILNT